MEIWSFIITWYLSFTDIFLYFESLLCLKLIYLILHVFTLNYISGFPILALVPAVCESLFQAVLIPCFCLSVSPIWRQHYVLCPPLPYVSACSAFHLVLGWSGDFYALYLHNRKPCCYYLNSFFFINICIFYYSHLACMKWLLIVVLICYFPTANFCVLIDHSYSSSKKYLPSSFDLLLELFSILLLSSRSSLWIPDIGSLLDIGFENIFFHCTLSFHFAHGIVRSTIVFLD